VRIIAPASARITEPDGHFIAIGRPRPIPASGRICRISISLHLAPRIKEVLKQEQFDIVHLHEPFMPMLCSAMLRFSNSVNIGTFHAAAGRPGYGLVRPVTTYLLKRRNRKLKGRIAVSSVAKNFASRHVSGEFAIIPNGVQHGTLQYRGGAPGKIPRRQAEHSLCGSPGSPQGGKPPDWGLCPSEEGIPPEPSDYRGAWCPAAPAL
jgi:hypothetical protein